MLEFGFYGILTDPWVGYEKLTEIMVEEGIGIIQLRMKGEPIAEVFRTAKRIRELVPPTAKFIVNDHPKIAADTGADGVHIGQNDSSYMEARKIVGPSAIVGISTHNTYQTKAACELKPDYIGIGPVFATPTKKIPDPVIGLEGMKKMLAIASVPSVVLGGIDHGNLRSVLERGARNICAVRCVNQSENPASEIRRIMEVLGDVRKST